MSRRSLRPRTSTPSYAIKLDIGEDDDDLMHGGGGSSEEDELAPDEASQRQTHNDASPAPADTADDASSVASTSTRGRTARGRGRGGGARGRGRGKGRGGKGGRSQRSASVSSGSDFAPAGGGSQSGASDLSSSDDSGADDSPPASLLAVSDEDGSIGDSDFEVVSKRRSSGAGPGGRRSGSGGASASKPSIVKVPRKAKRGFGQPSTSTSGKMRGDLWTFSEGNPPLVPHYSSYLTQPPSLRARSKVARTDVPQRPATIEEVTGRVRTFTEAIMGMTPWDAWAGEGWRPDASLAPAAATEDEVPAVKKASWEGVEGSWSDMRVLTAEQAAPHLPAPRETAPTKFLAGHLTPSTPQSEHSLPVHGSTALADLGVRKTGSIFNPGGPVWSVDWCPMSEEESEKRGWKLYLAVAAHSNLESDTAIGYAKPKDTPGSIQIWSVSPSSSLLAKPPASKLSMKSKDAPTAAPLSAKPKPRKSGRGKSKGRAEEQGVESEDGAPEVDAVVEGTRTPEEEMLVVDAQDDAALEGVASGRNGLESTSRPTNSSTSNGASPAKPSTSANPADAINSDVEMTEEPDKPSEVGGDGSDLFDEWATEMHLAMVVCFEGGMPNKLQWCPINKPESTPLAVDAPAPKLGVIAGTFEDGTVKLFAIPDPEAVRIQSGSKDDTVYVHLTPLTTLETDDSTLLSFDWGSDSIIATGSSNGRVATWDVKEAVLSGDEEPLPLCISQVQDTSVRSLSFARVPQADAHGQYRYDWEQHLLVTVGFHRIALTDLRECGASSMQIRVGRSAFSCASVASIQHGAYIVGEGDYQAYIHSLRPAGVGTLRRVAAHQGPIWSLSTSDYHPNLASGSADGALMVTNTLRGTTKRRTAWTTLLETVYRLDKNENTGELRMLDNILPQNLNTQVQTTAQINETVGATTSFSNKDLNKLNAYRQPSAAWAPEIGVLSTAWNSGCGIGRAGLLASGMACGLARVDVMLDGRWRPTAGKSKEVMLERLRSKQLFL